MIRVMTVSDIPRVAEIHVFGWRCAYRGFVSDEHLFNNMQVSKRIERFTQHLNDKDNTLDSYVFDDGIIKAFLTIGPCRDEDKPSAFELCGLYVDPCFQGEGVGTKLALYCEKIAAERGFKEVILWTFEQNPVSRAFYEKLDYKLDGATMIVESVGAQGVRYSKNI
ncbi:MAG: GNAT family N-acetyltransferase [Defluviitaleaceae bacterium]|nr:GNAT family N-acetyltransferase [Defluviitaleaceae bacterium]